MTEEEAKTKWCPFARVMGFDDETAGNRWGGNQPLEPSGSECIGSACMAWRWEERSQAIGPEGRRITIDSGGVHHESQGHCGLAGKP